MSRTIEQWMEILGGKRGNDAARAIFGDLIHYRSNGQYEADDKQQLANAMEAWHKLRTAGKAY